LNIFEPLLKHWLFSLYYGDTLADGGGGGGGVKVTRNIQMWIWKAQLEEKILH
jgi:hypothetical protein